MASQHRDKVWRSDRTKENRFRLSEVAKCEKIYLCRGGLMIRANLVRACLCRSICLSSLIFSHKIHLEEGIYTCSCSSLNFSQTKRALRKASSCVC